MTSSSGVLCRIAVALALVTYASAFFAAPATALQYSLTVPGSANLFGAGQATLPAPEGNGAGTPPQFVTLPAGTARYFQVVSSSGLVSYTPTVASSGPDGVPYTTYQNCNWSGLSGYRLGGIRVLSGVALSDSVPVPPAVVGMVVGTLTFAELTPGVRQMFPVGDGLTGTGSGLTQTFRIPDEATRLYFGFLDSYTGLAPGWYGDNGGQVGVTIEVLGSLLAVGDTPARELRITGTSRLADGGVALAFDALAGEPVMAQVFDVAGRIEQVSRIPAAGGPGRFDWHARDAAGTPVRPGLYLARLTQGARAVATKILVLR
jgi:hypothetical protein